MFSSSWRSLGKRERELLSLLTLSDIMKTSGRRLLLTNCLYDTRHSQMHDDHPTPNQSKLPVKGKENFRENCCFYSFYCPCRCHEPYHHCQYDCKKCWHVAEVNEVLCKCGIDRKSLRVGERDLSEVDLLAEYILCPTSFWTYILSTKMHIFTGSQL